VNVGVKLVAFALVLAALFGAGAALGSVVGPIDVGGGSHRGPTSPATTVVPHDAGTHR
jgi:hypothetical protein